MKGVCYCDGRTGGCSQCVAGLWVDQQCCDFYGKHSFADRCTHLRPNDDNHCASFEAQDFGRNIGVVRIEDVLGADRDVLSIDEDGNLAEDYKAHGCRDCVLFPCRDVNSIAKDKARKGQPLSEEDLSNMGSLCLDFVDETTFTEDLGNLGGGIVL